jgi:hypothetical protein
VVYDIFDAKLHHSPNINIFLSLQNKPWLLIVVVGKVKNIAQTCFVSKN